MKRFLPYLISALAITAMFGGAVYASTPAFTSSQLSTTTPTPGNILETDGSGNHWIANTASGSTLITAGTGISTTTSTGGAVTVTNTGVTSLTAGTNITLSGSTGGVIINASGGGGTGTVSTSTHEIAGEVPYWTSNSGTPALLGQAATSTLTAGTGLTGSFTHIGSGGSIALSVPVSVANGGTATTTFNTGDLLTYNNALGYVTATPDVAVGTVLISNGVGAMPTYSNAPSVASMSASVAISTPVIRDGGLAGSSITIQGTSSVSPTTPTVIIEAASTGLIDTQTLAGFGIGTTTPTTQLSIQGNQYTSGTAFFGGAITATSTLTLSALTGTQCLHEISGVVSGTGSDCGSGGSAYPFPLASNATSTLTNFLGGIGTTVINATSTATSTIGNLDGVLTATAYPGADIGAKINAAYAALPATGGVISLPTGTYSFSTQISIQTNGKPVALEGQGAGSTILMSTAQATSTIFNDGQSINGSNGIDDMTIEGTSTTDIAPGVQFGGANGYAYGTTKNLSVTDFGNNITLDNNVYIDNFSHILSNFGTSTLQFEWSNGSGENISFTNGSVFADGKNSAGTPSYTNCVNLVPNPNQGSASINFTDTSFDKCQVHIGTENNIFFDSPHFEILGNTGSAYTPIMIDADINTTVSIVNPHFIDGNNSSFSPAQWITNAGNLYITNAAVSEYGGYTIPTLVNNTGNGARSYTNINNVAGTGYTNLEANTGQANNAYSLNSGVLTLGTTTSAAATTPLQVFGPTWQGGDLYQAFIGDTNYNGLSIGYDNTHNWAAIHPTQLGVTGLDLFFGSPFSTANGVIFKNSGNVGIGTTTPTARFVSQAASTTAGTVQSGYNGVVAILGGLENTTFKLFFEIDQWGHQITSGDVPSVTGGTSSVTGNDNNGNITVTGTALTSVVLTFAHPWTAAPDCVTSDNSLTFQSDPTSVSATAMTIGFTAGVTTGTVWYQCRQHQ